MRVSTHHASGIDTSTSGMPTASHCRKPMCTPRVFSMTPAAMALVGLPISVPRPPIEAA